MPFKIPQGALPLAPTNFLKKVRQKLLIVTAISYFLSLAISGLTMDFYAMIKNQVDNSMKKCYYYIGVMLSVK